MSRQSGKVMLAIGSMLTVPGLFLSGTVAMADWRDWWRTPEQQAEAALESGDMASLKSIAPDTFWQGIAEYKSGEYEVAAQSFDQEIMERLADGQVQAANQALYNRGVSEVLDRQFDKAVKTFNQVLETDSEFADAQHNRDIALQLIQQQQQSQGGDEQNPDDSSGSDDQPAADSSQSAQDGEPGESGESSGEQNSQSNDEGEEAPDAAADSEEQRRQDEQSAQDALEAEAQARAQAGGSEPGDQSDGSTARNDQQAAGVDTQEPLSESEQATEQWLRQIPDDPAGLLRRKLQQSHQLEYPEVRDAQQPW